MRAIVLATTITLTATVPLAVNPAVVRDALVAIAVQAGCTEREAVQRQRVTDTTATMVGLGHGFIVEVSCEVPDAVAQEQDAP